MLLIGLAVVAGLRLSDSEDGGNPALATMLDRAITAVGIDPAGGSGGAGDGERSDDIGGPRVVAPGGAAIAEPERSVVPALLAEADLPDGWAELPGALPPGRGPFCVDGPAVDGSAFVATQVAFQHQGSGAVISNAVQSFDSAAQATEYVGRARAAIAACAGENLPEAELEVGAAEGDLGDEHVGADLEPESSDVPAVGRIDYVRRGNVVVVLVVIGASDDDLAVARDALVAVMGRL